MSDKDDWETPKKLFCLLDNEFNFDLDPCCSKETAKCNLFYTKEDDGLEKEWKGNVFMNPPYGRQIVNWVKRRKKSLKKARQWFAWYLQERIQDGGITIA